MKIRKKIIFLIPFCLFGILKLFGQNSFGSSELLGEKEYNLEANNDITITIDKLATGFHHIEVWFEPYDIERLRRNDEPIYFSCIVEMNQKGKIKSKSFSFVLEGVALGRGRPLFSVPGDFFWSRKGNLQITIKDISFDDTFAQYYQKITFRIRRTSLFFR